MKRKETLIEFSGTLNKKSVQKHANDKVAEVLTEKQLGDKSASEFYTFCRGMMEYCKSIIAHHDLKRAVEEEVGDYLSEYPETSMPVSTHKIAANLETRTTGDKYDFSNDAEWNKMTDEIDSVEAHLKELKLKRSGREATLKTYAKRLYENPKAEKLVNDDGEVLEPPKMIKAGEPVVVFKW